MSDATDGDTKAKELGTTNFHIKIHIPRLSILPNLSVVSSTKQKSTLSPVSPMLDPPKHNSQGSPCRTKPEEDQYLPSPSPDDQFAIDVKSNNKSNDAVATIEGLFLNIGHRSSYERLTEKTVHETCEFFMHSPRHMSSKD